MARSGCFQDIRIFVACYGLLVLTDVMAGTMKKSCLTTIERRFNLPTTITALLASSFQIGTLTMLLFVSYFGSRWNRPRALFCGSVLLVLGNLIVTIPQFIGERYEYDDVSSNATLSSTQVLQCSKNNTDLTQKAGCGEEKEPTNKLYILLVIGMMINGVGGTPIQPLGISYIDDNAHETNSPLYLGITTSIAMIGPMVGYVLSSVVLRWWVDIGWIDTSTVTITPTHPSWVGAWWLGLIICTTGIAITMIPFLFFPKNMKNQTKNKDGQSGSVSAWTERMEHDDKETQESKRNKENEVVEETKKQGSVFARESRGLMDTLKRVFGNVTFLLLVAKFYFGSASMVGIINFFPKYLEVGFGVSAAKANLLTGMFNVPSLIVGTLLGSIIMKRYSLTPLGATKLIAFATVLVTCSIAPLIFIGCDTIDIAGITVPYSDSLPEDLPNVNSACNTDCNCADGTYAPVCGSDGISYISPCHAGCTDVIVDETGRTQFTDCRCVSRNITSDEEHFSWAAPERCEFSKCSHLLPFVIGLKSAGSFFGGLAGTALYISLIRSVDKKDKAFAIGLNLMVVRVLAWIPGPLIYGALIDSTCTYWGKKPCTDRAYCKVYDNNSYRNRFYGLNLCYNVLSCITIFILYIVIKGKRGKDSEKSDGNPTEKIEMVVKGEDYEKPVSDSPKKSKERQTLLSLSERDDVPRAV